MQFHVLQKLCNYFAIDWNKLNDSVTDIFETWMKTLADKDSFSTMPHADIDPLRI